MSNLSFGNPIMIAIFFIIDLIMFGTYPNPFPHKECKLFPLEVVEEAFSILAK
jgi:hypothetical protein